ncbi:MAG: anhydro-N-acetylmuramic acid kinase [Bacilli bacterium]
MITQLQHVLHKSKRLAVGLMSGTSMDGIDAALVEIEGAGVNTKIKLIDFLTYPFTNEERDQILELCRPASGTVDKICEMNVQVGRKFAQAALAVIDKAGINKADVDFISSHGQTIYHMPEKLATLQIGELSVIAAETGCLTVGDFRPADMAVGGQGAPLVPYVDYLLFRSEDKGRVLMNIGGISNVTIIKSGAKPEEVTAFDTGPGNMLIDWIVSLEPTVNLLLMKVVELVQEERSMKSGLRSWLNKIVISISYLQKVQGESYILRS